MGRPDYRIKMLNRKSPDRTGHGDKIRKKWEDPIWRENTISNRKKKPRVEKPILLSSTELSQRNEVSILKKYYLLAKKNKKFDICGKRGWYRKSTEYLLTEIDKLKNIFGEI